MSEWKIFHLDELADIRVSNVDKKSQPGEGAVRLCNYMDVYSNDYITRGLVFMEATASAAECEKFKVEQGDVMITKDSETPDDIGIPTVVLDDIDNLICSYHLALIKPKKNVVNPIYLSKQLASADVSSYFSRMAAGSTRYGLSNGAIGRTRIPLPPLFKQNKIAVVLQTVDTAIEKTEALIEKYQQIKAGLMHDLFTRGITADGQLRPPREQAPELYQQTAIGWIPKEWEIKSLTSAATYQHGRPFPSTDYTNEGVLLLRPGNLHISGYVLFDDAHSTRIPKSWEKAASGYVVTKGDILMNLTAQSLDDEFLGRVCLYDDAERSLLNQRIARFKELSVEHEFLYWILRSKQFRKQIDNTSQGTKVQHLYNRDLDKVKLGVPIKSEEQVEISLRLNNVSEKIHAEMDSLQKLKNQKSGLMHDLLTGKVRVKLDSKTSEMAGG